jgi:hypothetical protein
LRALMTRLRRARLRNLFRRATRLSTFKLPDHFFLESEERQRDGMGPARFIRNGFSSNASPITVTEFANALFKRWSPRCHGKNTVGEWKFLGIGFHGNYF